MKKVLLAFIDAKFYLYGGFPDLLNYTLIKEGPFSIIFW